jgi:hypothetical protein
LRDGRGLVAGRLERLVQEVGTVGKGDGFHGQLDIARGMGRLLNHERVAPNGSSLTLSI